MRGHQTTMDIGGHHYELDENNLFHCHMEGCNFTCNTVVHLKNHSHIRAIGRKATNAPLSIPDVDQMEIDVAPSGK